MGNSWGSSYTGTDANGDGIGDTSFTVPESLGSDTAPLMQTASNYIVTGTLASAPVAGFSATPTSGDVPLTVRFTDESTGTVASRAWDFNNDGVTDSTEQNPSHTYTTAGTYTVKLTVTNAAGSDDEIKTDYIAVGGVAAPVVAFSANVTNGDIPLAVAFNDESTGSATAWAWDFDNDGVTDSTTKNATHAYTTAGTYSVNHTVTGWGGSTSLVKTDYITAVMPMVPVADFTATPTSGGAPLTVTFNDTSSSNPTRWAWDFNNDGTTDATTRNATYTYSVTGTYTVNLTVTNAAGSDSEVKAGLINAYGIPDLSVTSEYSQSTVPYPDLFAHYTGSANKFGVMIRNSGSQSAGEFKVSFNTGGNITNVTVPAGLAAGSYTFVNITDSIDRSVGASVPVTVTADPDNLLSETDTTNNQYSYNATVIRNGYTGMPRFQHTFLQEKQPSLFLIRGDPYLWQVSPPYHRSYEFYFDNTKYYLFYNLSHYILPTNPYEVYLKA